MKKRVVRIVLATVIAPLVIVPIVFAYLTVIDPTASSASELLKWFAVFAYVGLVIAYSATVVFGLPVYFLFMHLKKESYLLFGLVGAGAAFAIGAFLLDYPFIGEDIVFMVILVVSGIGVSIAFRGIAGVPEQRGLNHE